MSTGKNCELVELEPGKWFYVTAMKIPLDVPVTLVTEEGTVRGLWEEIGEGWCEEFQREWLLDLPEEKLTWMFSKLQEAMRQFKYHLMTTCLYQAMQVVAMQVMVDCLIDTELKVHVGMVASEGYHQVWLVWRKAEKR